MSRQRSFSFPLEVTGKTFEIRGGSTFTVLAGQYFPQKKISKQHSEYLQGLREGVVVSVAFFGQPVPVITHCSKSGQGVTRLLYIDLDGRLVKGSSTISKALGLGKTRQPLGLTVV